MRNRLIVAVTLSALFCSAAYASLPVIGAEGFREFDPSHFPPDKKLSYKLMKARCTKCHNLDRVVQAIGTGIAPISWQPFDQDSAKTYGEQIMRKANANLTKEETDSIVQLMQWLITGEKEKYLQRNAE